MKVLYHSLAERDIEKALDYYHAIDPVLAQDFLQEVDSSVARISREPYRFRQYRGHLPFSAFLIWSFFR